MPGVARYLTHPQVAIDPAVDIRNWGLSPIGAARIRALTGAVGLSATTQVTSSAERKAVDSARPLAAALGCTVEIRPAMHENDRSATGYLPSADFERMADAFFARPDQSVRGWETAQDAQTRICAEVDAALADPAIGDILFVGHGAVGTLLMCHLAGLLISRSHDQPAGGGNVFAFEIETRRLLSRWQPMESLLHA